jgi:putative ABC transport system permease protein
MKFRDIVKRANHNTWNRKKRSVLTILSVTVGALTLTLAVGLGLGVKNVYEYGEALIFERNVVTINKATKPIDQDTKNGVPKYDPEKKNALVSEFKGSDILTGEEIDQIRKIEGIETIYPMYNVPALYMSVDGQDYLANIISSKPNSEYNLPHGDGFSSIDDKGILVSSLYAKSLSVTTKELLDKTVTVHFVNPSTGAVITKALEVEGVVPDPENEFYNMVNYSTVKEVAEELNMLETDYLVATLDAEHRETEKVKEILTQVEGVSNQIYAGSPEANAAEGALVIRILRIAFIGFAAIVLLAALFGISNTLYMSVLERTPDIGLMRALGAKRSDIFHMFATESALIGFWGALVGIILGTGLSLVINAVAQNFIPEMFSADTGLSLIDFSPMYLLGIVLALTAVAFLAGVMPARKAAKTNVIEALRYE